MSLNITHLLSLYTFNLQVRMLAVTWNNIFLFFTKWIECIYLHAILTMYGVHTTVKIHNMNVCVYTCSLCDSFQSIMCLGHRITFLIIVMIMSFTNLGLSQAQRLGNPVRHILGNYNIVTIKMNVYYLRSQ